ncbi:hypothetical protein MAR_000687 [Mya arenaria]|uniref:Uncharacterized protein n=1 Tax=Mya arenaria TaxID=6604 RepID=A0ABY7FCE0_MYAAR|nr:hypothetical protein MAR_000687 [Mya arenaria]
MDTVLVEDEGMRLMMTNAVVIKTCSALLLDLSKSYTQLCNLPPAKRLHPIHPLFEPLWHPTGTCQSYVISPEKYSAGLGIEPGTLKYQIH